VPIEAKKRLTTTSSSELNLNRPATGPKVSSEAINYFINFEILETDEV
jgi:hypothetical protein